MATLDKTGPMGLFQHRRWEDVTMMILGAAILVSPMFFDSISNTTVIAVTALVGAALVILAGMEQLALRRWEEYLALIGGVWIMASPFVLNYAGQLRTWHLVLGAAVALLAVLEIWQDRDRDLEA